MKNAKKTTKEVEFGKIFAWCLYMKMTANIPPVQNNSDEIQNDFQQRIAEIISTKWKLKSILETGVATDEADFQDVEVVFSQYHIYALYGNRVDKFRYKFLSPKTFIINIEGIDVKCRIKEFNCETFIFHVDFKNSHFIVELEKD